MAKKVLDEKAKAKKQMKIAIAGGVLFVALLAYQVPKTMAMLNAKPAVSTTASAPTPAPVETPTPGATPAPVTPGAAVPVAATPAASGADVLVVNADLSPAPLGGQLAALTQFTSKDPFRQQVGSSGDATAAPAPSTTPAKPAGGIGGSGSFTPGPGAGSGSTPPGPAPTVATISVNGVEMAVNVKTDFPLDSPFFSLVAITATTVKIGIAGGSLATGSPTVTLKKGKPLTLMNTADGTRYVLVFVSVGDTTTPAASSSTTPAAPTTTTTTPTTGTSTTAGP